MRRAPLSSLAVAVATLLLGLGALLPSAPVAAQGGPGCGSGSSVFGCSGGGGGGAGGGSGTGTSGSGGGSPVDYERYFDEDGTSEDSAPDAGPGCWGIQAVPAGQGMSWEEAVTSQNSQGGNGVLWGNCDIEDTIDPAFLAQMYWEQQAAPPPPTPLQIDPGKALTGLPAYLEIGGEVPATQSFSTPIGTLTFTMTPRYVVTWGDGASTETTSQGGPRPNGDIVHTYIEEGGVTVTVAAYWHATWTLAGGGGDLPELPVPTEGSLDLPVEQYQAVIDPS